MPGNSQFVLGLLVDKTVLPRARAVGLARILCRPDIVQHLAANSRTVQVGQLPMHMQSVFDGAEAAMRRAPRQPRAERARKRHEVTGVTRGQMMFVWVAFADAYINAARSAGYNPTERELWAYMDAMKAFGQAYGLQEVPTTLDEVEKSSVRLMSRIRPDDVPPGGWSHFAQVVRSDWFVRNNEIPLMEVVQSVWRNLPSALVKALQR